jgi:hypothetical protein
MKCVNYTFSTCNTKHSSGSVSVWLKTSCPVFVLYYVPFVPIANFCISHCIVLLVWSMLGYLVSKWCNIIFRKWNFLHFKKMCIKTLFLCAQLWIKHLHIWKLQRDIKCACVNRITGKVVCSMFKHFVWFLTLGNSLLLLFFNFIFLYNGLQLSK